MPGEALVAMADQVGIRILAQVSLMIRSRSRTSRRGFGAHFRPGDLGGFPKPGNRGDIFRGRADATLLAAAVYERFDLFPLADVQRTDALGPVQFVRRKRKKINGESIHIQWDLPHGLHGIRVEQCTVRPGELRQFGDRLERADHIIGCHHRDQARIWDAKPGQATLDRRSLPASPADS